eukprot:6349400-Lingulodinium_polyedra.AAC.1
MTPAVVLEPTAHSENRTATLCAIIDQRAVGAGQLADGRAQARPTQGPGAEVIVSGTSDEEI